LGPHVMHVRSRAKPLTRQYFHQSRGFAEAS
jgi:hypothetical protein